MIAQTIEKPSDLDSRAVAAKNTEGEMERLISDFNPFLHSRVARYLLKDDSFGRDELLSSAMLAFYEAVKSYDIEKGHFFPFADQVVRCNLIDHVRKIYRKDEQTLPLEEDEDRLPTAVYNLSVQAYEEGRRRESIANEIEQFKAELASWGITMESLARHSPKHKKLAFSYKEAVKKILASPEIMQTIVLKHYFPVKAISEISGLPQKKLARVRSFILASLIIQIGDYDFLSDYVK